MSFADNPVWTGLADLSTYRQGLLTFKAEPGCLSFFWLKLSRLSSPFTGRVEITQHQRRMDLLDVATDDAKLTCGKAVENLPLASLARLACACIMRVHPCAGSERVARAAGDAHTPCASLFPHPMGGRPCRHVNNMGRQNYAIFLRVFFSFFNIFKAFSLETHSCALI